jgi:SAM-dependent methyltransferase
MKKFKVSFPYFLEYPAKVDVDKIGILGFFGWIFQKFGKKTIKQENILITERIVEVPGVYMLLSSIKDGIKNILEVGHVNSSLSLELASLGYNTTGIDLRSYPFSHKNLKSIRGNFIEYNFEDKFDCVISVSTFEHLGFNKRYGGENNEDSGLDKKAVEKTASVLKEEGHFILTVPYASRERNDTWFKTYTRETAKELVAGDFSVASEKYFFRQKDEWLETTLDRSNDPELPYDGVAVFLLRKK